MDKLLLIDDEVDVQYSFRRIFDSPEIELTTASSGEEGLKQVARVRPDLVIMDVRMGGMNGLETLRRIRQTDANATEITGAVAGRFTGTSDANVNLYKSCITNFGGARNGMIVSYVNGATTTHQTAAFAWADNTFTTVAGAMFGSPATVRNYENGVVQVSLTNNADLNNVSGSVGVVGIANAGTSYDFDNFLARRYTEPEPTLTLAAETNLSLPLWGTRENSVANQPTLNVHYLRDVTLNAATPGISEITVNWAFPTGSTAANYDGVLFAKQAGASAPAARPSFKSVVLRSR